MPKETWESDEFGKSHEGRVGVLLEDRSVPEPVYIDSVSGGFGHRSTFWAHYNGHPLSGPRAHVLRAVCACGWTGTEYPIDWERIGETALYEDEAVRTHADNCLDDWYRHLDDVEASTVAYPEDVNELLKKTDEALDALTSDAPAAALKAAVRLEILANSIGYHAANSAYRTMESEELGTALGITARAAEDLLFRYRRR
ncbi:hypothetical protein K2224_33790 (plasmid) [Streptomyces sp. BHT-5-2]|uniref:hypothetical protein n=1 Tax=unclassified Streptomyces TaxID=2593676 RepID=UPI001C8EA05C|nr:hypothetical protein [Streptomyces sp. BHT-5-2]QZL08122.1 hypothetical protein K2224_33790 [Streptomyces sp. BHT-5-2]